MLSDRFIFVHIPKTGGTTFNRIIRKLFEEQGFVFRDKSFRYDRYDEIILFTNKSERRIPRQLNTNKHRYIIGHFTVEKYKDLDWPMITFLRDPIKRVLSYYSIWFNNPQSPKWPIEKFAEKTSNYMYFMTKGNLEQFSFIGICECYQESLQIFEKVAGIKIPDKNLWYNKTPDRKVVTLNKQQIKVVEEFNRKDRRLYNQALKLFDRQVKRWLK